MKRVLFLTNIKTPYRVEFFNQLAKHCDLTVLYEKEKPSNRNADWMNTTECDYKVKFLSGISIKREHKLSLGACREVLADYDQVIIGCYNSPSQMLAILLLRLLGHPYDLNLDGELFLEGNSIKAWLKRFFLRGARNYYIAGEKSAESLRRALGECHVIPYYFSSLTEESVKQNGNSVLDVPREKTVLVIGQNYDYKGMDIALEAARMDPEGSYKFVGMGSRTEMFLKEHDVPSNVHVIPFLQKAELEEEYRHCGMLVLPSRQECWGLVINEAASFGTPIVSTWGSGAAVEFLADDYSQYLAKPGDAEDLLRCIRTLREDGEAAEFCDYIRNKAMKYTIEQNVRCYQAVYSK